MTTSKRDHDQVGVDPLERLGGVGGLATEPGHVHGHAVDVRDVADLVDGVGDVVPAVLAEVEDEVDVGDLPVLGEQLGTGLPLLLGRGSDVGGQRTLVGDAVDLRHLLGLLVHGGQVLVGQPRLLVVDDQGGDVVGVDRVRELLEDFRRLGRLGQPGRGLVVLDVDQLRAERTDGGHQDQPDGEDDPLGDPAGELAGDVSMHGGNPFRGRGQSASGISLRRPAAPTFLIDDDAGSPKVTTQLV